MLHFGRRVVQDWEISPKAIVPARLEIAVVKGDVVLRCLDVRRAPVLLLCGASGRYRHLVEPSDICRRAKLWAQKSPLAEKVVKPNHSLILTSGHVIRGHIQC